MQAPVLAVHVFLVQGPADALHGAALQLALDITRVDRRADVLDRGIADHRRTARFRIDFDVADMRAEARSRALGVDVRRAADRTAGFAG